MSYSQFTDALRDVALFKRTFTPQNVKCGFCILHATIDLGTIEMIKHLLSIGVDANKKSKSNMTALHAAARKGCFEICELLLPLFPEAVFLRDDDGKLPIHHASEIAIEEYQSLDLENFPEFHPERVQICSLLLDNGSELDGVDNRGFTPLKHALDRGMCDVVVFLLNKGANIFSVKFEPGDDVTRSWVTKLFLLRLEQTDIVALFALVSSKRFRYKFPIFNIIGKDMVNLITQHAWGFSQLTQEDSDIFLMLANMTYFEARNKAEAASKKQRTGE